MEHVFFRLHLRFVSTVCGFVSQKVRKGFEFAALVGSLALLALLCYLHIQFVSPYGTRSCLVDIVKGDVASKPEEADILEIEVETVWTGLTDELRHGIQGALFVDGKHGEVSTRSCECSNQVWGDNCASEKFWLTPGDRHGMERTTLGDLSDWIVSPRYRFSREKGLLLLADKQLSRHNVSARKVTIPRNSSCFGSFPMQFLLENAIGYDTVVMNCLISLYGGAGYMYNALTNELFNLNYASEFVASIGGIETYFLFKAGVLVTTLFLFFTITTLVSFTLRETQERMLKFTFLLQHYIRNRLPYTTLIITHVVESLVFVPIMVGILFFLFEFFNDQLLAFMVLALVWLCELFSVISLRTRISVRYFPRIFFCLFSLFHIYFFSFPFGFSYLALVTTVAALVFTMTAFWNRYEVPALESGLVSLREPREAGTVINHQQVALHPMHTSSAGRGLPPPAQGTGHSDGSSERHHENWSPERQYGEIMQFRASQRPIRPPVVVETSFERPLGPQEGDNQPVGALERNIASRENSAESPSISRSSDDKGDPDSINVDRTLDRLISGRSSGHGRATDVAGLRSDRTAGSGDTAIHDRMLDDRYQANPDLITTGGDGMASEASNCRDEVRRPAVQELVSVRAQEEVQVDEESMPRLSRLVYSVLRLASGRSSRSPAKKSRAARGQSGIASRNEGLRIRI